MQIENLRLIDGEFFIATLNVGANPNRLVIEGSKTPREIPHFIEHAHWETDKENALSFVTENSNQIQALIEKALDETLVEVLPSCLNVRWPVNAMHEYSS